MITRIQFVIMGIRYSGVRDNGVQLYNESICQSRRIHCNGVPLWYESFTRFQDDALWRRDGPARRNAHRPSSFSAVISAPSGRGIAAAAGRVTPGSRCSGAVRWFCISAARKAARIFEIFLRVVNRSDARNRHGYLTVTFPSSDEKRDVTRHLKD